MRDPVVTITARTGAPPELRYLNDGTALCTVRAAWSNDRPDGNGGWISDHTTWVGIEWWADAAEMTSALNIGTGDLIRVTGHQWMDEFTRKDGSHGAGLKLRADGTPKVWPKRDPAAPAGGQGQGRGAGLVGTGQPAAAPPPEPTAGPAQGTVTGGGHDEPPF